MREERLSKFTERKYFSYSHSSSLVVSLHLRPLFLFLYPMFSCNFHKSIAASNLSFQYIYVSHLISLFTGSHDQHVAEPPMERHAARLESCEFGSRIEVCESIHGRLHTWYAGVHDLSYR